MYLRDASGAGCYGCNRSCGSDKQQRSHELCTNWVKSVAILLPQTRSCRRPTHGAQWFARRGGRLPRRDRHKPVPVQALPRQTLPLSSISTQIVINPETESISIATGVSNTVLVMDKPQAVLFDAYGTLFDVYSVGLLAEQLFPGQGQALSVLWRDKQIEYTRLVTTSNHGAHYRPFWDLTRAALVYAIKRLVGPPAASAGAQPFESQVDRLMNQYRSLSAFPENREVLRELKGRGIPTGILSNGDPAMLQLAIKSAGLDGLLDHVLSVDGIRKYKTAPEAYALGEQATGLPARQIAFVSCNAWDALAATWYGYQTLWVNRYQLPFEELGTPPTRSGDSLRDVLAFFS